MQTQHEFVIAPVRSTKDLADIVRLFRDYAQSLGIDLTYQDFAGDLAALPGKYAPPRGALLLARRLDGTPAGCVALRPMSVPRACEMKRLYVAPEGRSAGLGRRLAEAIVQAAEQNGYEQMYLDTLPSMQAALALYRTLQFERIDPYYPSPVAGTVYMRRILRAP